MIIITHRPNSISNHHHHPILSVGAHARTQGFRNFTACLPYRQEEERTCHAAVTLLSLTVHVKFTDGRRVVILSPSVALRCLPSPSIPQVSPPHPRHSLSLRPSVPFPSFLSFTLPSLFCCPPLSAAASLPRFFSSFIRSPVPPLLVFLSLPSSIHRH